MTSGQFCVDSESHRHDVSVVIPFFQREHQILNRALRSVAGQAFSGSVEVLVVDDESPVPVDAELRGISFPPNMTLRVIRQRNQGPGSARNAGLNALCGRVVAFLDSDDEWHQYHLRSAVAAIDSGAQLYVSSRTSGEFSDGADMWRERWDALIGDPALERTTEGGRVRDVSGVFEKLLRATQLSSVCYERSFAPDIRFLAHARWSGEDFHFLVALLSRRPEVVVSVTAPSVQGSGVNIFAGLVFASEEGFRALESGLLAYRDLLRPGLAAEFALKEVRRRIESNRKSFATSWYSVLANRPVRAIGLLRRRAMVDIEILGTIAKLVPEMGRRRYMRR